jgi:hypothetical protein
MVGGHTGAASPAEGARRYGGLRVVAHRIGWSSPVRKTATAASLLIVATGQTACRGAGDSQRQPAGASDRQGPLRELRGAPIDKIRQSLVNPVALATSGNIIVVADQGDSALKVIDRRTGQLLAAAGGSGGGPGEFRDVTSVSLVERPDGSTAIWAFDSRESRLSSYRFDRSGSFGVVHILPLPELASRGIEVLWLNDSTMVASGTFLQSRFAVLNRDGSHLRPVGDIPYASAEVPAFAAQQMLQPSMGVEPDGWRVAIGARWAGRVDIYNVASGKAVRAQSPGAFDPEIRVGIRGTTPAFLQDRSTRFGYVAVAANKHRIYALYSGRTRQGHPGRANYAEYVHVFDWSGELTEVIHLDRDLYRIAVDSGGTHLYGIDSHAGIVAFSLSDDLPS